MADDRLNLTRRKALAGLGLIGTAGAGAGLGTSALFSDTESFEGNAIEAGALDLFVDWETRYDGPGEATIDSGTRDGDPAVLVDLGDVKPGDRGQWTFCFRLVDNPGYLWLGGDLTGNAENGVTEPESAVDLTDGSIGVGKGELADVVEVELSYEGGPTITSGTLKSVLEDLQFGRPLDGQPGTAARDCYPTEDGPCLVVDWEVPASVGNEIQGDSVQFALQFFAEQCRHNDGTNNPTLDAVVSPGGSVQSAVDSAAAGDVIGIASGTFVEQIVVDKPVTLAGAGVGSTVIRSPDSLTSQFSCSGNSYYPVVSMLSDGAELWNLTVDGDRQGDGHDVFCGVGAHNAGVRISHVEVTKISNDPLNGAQHGLGIAACNDGGTDRTTVVDSCDVNDYQKTGIVGQGEGLDLCVLDSVVTGIGPTDQNGQNGVQISDVSQAVVVGNVIRDNYYTPNDYAASGIIPFGASDVLVASNVIEDNNFGIGVGGGGNVTATRNNIDGNDFGAVNFGSNSFDATDNWWGASDGPSGGESDPVTGATADGSGDAVVSSGSADSIHWDPFATSAFSL